MTVYCKFIEEQDLDAYSRTLVGIYHKLEDAFGGHKFIDNSPHGWYFENYLIERWEIK